MKIRALLLTAVLALSLAGNAAYADSGLEKAGAEIKGAIEQEYKEYYADSLEAQKDNFHGTGKTSFHEATLGEGIPYYQLNVHDNSISHEMAGYKFPLYLEEAQVGVIEATLESGAWTIYNISNHNDFDNTVKRLEAEYAGKGTVELIDDKRYELDYLYINNEVNETYIDLTNEQNISPSEVRDAVSESADALNSMNRNSNEGAILVGGGHHAASSDGGHNSLITAIVLFGLSLVFAVPLVISAVQRRRASDVLQ
ncbi:MULTISPECIES: hypothetical protein [Paenibacillus]|uniref:Uncharacterized protein n=1 Tax=Paenibacillus silagei TaxID=1670801 RepID=A0ABS4NPT3_9BACL|nr:MULTISPECIES: hypothetical protein [Paenibacillus]ETT79744.1 hypothetical protein C173_01257 [Paenibacillus sp. FSL R7-277]MBP2112061.1 hypothetical protein [Paenibacillus silagei]